jgi:hypothetical protein
MKHESEEFKTFWAIWRPHRRHTDGRGDARDGFEKMVAKGANPQDIIDGAEWYLSHVLDDNERSYIPLAKTWINKEAWADYCDDKRDFEERQRQVEEAKNNVAQFPKGQTKFLKQFAAGE